MEYSITLWELGLHACKPGPSPIFWIKYILLKRNYYFQTICLFPRLYVLCSTSQAITNATQSVIIEIQKKILENSSLGQEDKVLFPRLFRAILRILQKLKAYVALLEARKNLTGCDFFTINNSLFLSIMSTSTTYLVIIIQFYMSSNTTPSTQVNATLSD